ncbi:hypothetical protein [Actinocorallia lasiicapitis]
MSLVGVIGGPGPILAGATALIVAASGLYDDFNDAKGEMRTQADVFLAQANSNNGFGEGGAWPISGRSLETGDIRKPQPSAPPKDLPWWMGGGEPAPDGERREKGLPPWAPAD